MRLRPVRLKALGDDAGLALSGTLPLGHTWLNEVLLLYDVTPAASSLVKTEHCTDRGFPPPGKKNIAPNGDG